MVKAERINDLTIKVTVGEVVCTCDDFLFEDRISLVDMLMSSEGDFSKEESEKIAQELHENYEFNE